MTRRGLPRVGATDVAWPLLLTLLTLGPLLVRPGFWLVGDMVFVPHQPWKPEWLGLDGGLPRAVPMDALVSLATYAVPGEVVQRVLLAGGFLLGGIGAARLVPAYPWWARAAAVSVVLWNPWVLEHLQMGQWAITLGYLVLPWVVLAARRVRRGAPGAWAPAALVLLAAAVCAPSSGVTAAVVLGVLVLGRSVRRWLLVAGLALVANLPWLLPSLLASASATVSATVSGAEAFAAFAARAESPLGVLPSLVSLGGTWKTSIVPAERTSAVVVALAGLLVLTALAGVRRVLADARAAGDDDRRAEVVRLAVVAGGALLLALLPTWGAGADVLGALAQRMPGAAMLRDSHRSVAPAALLLATGLAGTTTAARDVVRRLGAGRAPAAVATGLLVLAPVVLLPSQGLGWRGDAVPVERYGPEWDDVAHLVAADPGPVVVLPWTGSFRRLEVSGGRAVLDPAPRYLPGTVLVDDRTFLDDTVVPAEDVRVGAVGAAVEAAGEDPAALAEALAGLGARWVLVERVVDRDDPAVVVPTGTVALDRGELLLVSLGTSDPVDGDRPVLASSRNDYGPLVLAGQMFALCLLLAAGWRILRVGG